MYYYDGEMAFIIVIVLVAVALLVLALKSFKSNSEADKDKIVKIDEPESKSVYISSSLSDGGSSRSDSISGPETVIDDDHLVRIIYRGPDKRGIWICPNCETENPQSNTRCFICHRAK